LLLARQLRGVWHSGARAKAVLGYTPLLTFEASLARFRSWYAAMHGWNSSHADLLAHL
jgi:hypothetical protein